MMKKILCLIMALMACAALALPAMAEESVFVPSIGYKDGPEVEQAVQDGEEVSGCIVVTSIPEARERTTDIFQEDRDLLLEVYEALSDGSMELPLRNDYVIRDLVDVSYMATECVGEDHGHREWLAQEDTTISITFDIGIPTGTDVTVMTYIDGVWEPIESVVNNGDGTLTCVFEDICPVVFCVEEDYHIGPPPKTGDEFGRKLPLWIALMAVSLIAIVVLVVLYRKKDKDGHKHHKHHRHHKH